MRCSRRLYPSWLNVLPLSFLKQIVYTASVHDITSQPLQQEKWWYHRVAWHDMNSDGLKDALSARAYLDAGNRSRLNPRLTDPLFVTRLTKGGRVRVVTAPFQDYPRMILILIPMVSLQFPLNINTKISTNMHSVWLL